MGFGYQSVGAVQGLEDVGKVILFLLPAMCLVESIDHMRLGAVRGPSKVTGTDPGAMRISSG